ncbi:hypothetical protein [Pseudoramibacter alactolyticus]|uniref:hypothetical protein n=1 Tax=Pseudoramibacter alactolyticus TaxID=113287 RepID=UPI0023553033|nr:hypothetical protein [Pseudoramibacter alactolyticus]MBM6968688.1 hypothetical protein [Pseudoramibacter alactolyticus]
MKRSNGLFWLLIVNLIIAASNSWKLINKVLVIINAAALLAAAIYELARRKA